jgi:predicted nucleotidyltransferase
VADDVVTVAERRRRRVGEMSAALEGLRRTLADDARARGGRYLLFGSAARGTMSPDSDVDILVDMPAAEEDAAWRFAEDACINAGLVPDVRPARLCSPRLRAAVEAYAETLG